MSTQITTAFKQQYSDAFALLYQQQESMLEGTVRKESQEAEMKFWDFIGEVDVSWDLPRHANTPQMDTPHSRRACQQHTAEWADLIDEDDKIQTLRDPQSAYIRAAVAAMNRAKDERILQALSADVLTGKTGSTTVHFYDTGESRSVAGDGTITAAGSEVGATTETGLTINKLGDIKNLMDEANIPAEGRTLVANVTNGNYLLGSTKVTSSDYQTVKALVRGEVGTFMGFTFKWLPSDRFATNSTDTGCYECFAYHRDAVLLTTAKDITTRITEESTKRFSVQVYAKMRIGAVRLQGPGVVRILLDKDPAADFTQT